MRHLDDGAIHAWLDGAASPEESRAIEEHIASCDACAARVAEARGLVAGASRILAALDHVPGGVIPSGRLPAPASLRGGRDVHARGPRWWTRASALRAAAALVFMAGAATVVARMAGEGSYLRAPADTEVEGLAAPLEESISLPESPARGATGNAAGAPVADRRATGDGVSESASARPPRIAAPTPMALPSAPPAPRAEVLADRGVVSELAGRASGVIGVGRAAAAKALPPADTAAAEMRARSAAEAREAPRITQDSMSAQRLRTEPSRLADVVVTATEPARPAVSQAYAAPLAPGGVPVTDLAGCYTITIGSWRDADAALREAIARLDERLLRQEREESVRQRLPALPGVLRLESTYVAIEGEGPRLALRAEGDTSAPSRDGSYWRLVGRDSLVLVWRDSLSETVVQLGRSGADFVGTAQQARRIAPATATRVAGRCSP